VTRAALARAGVAGASVALAGAFLFGAWHVLVGGVLHGNPRAGEFGVALAGFSAAALAALVGLVRGRRRSASA
jgi:hypothetical protein